MNLYPTLFKALILFFYIFKCSLLQGAKFKMNNDPNFPENINKTISTSFLSNTNQIQEVCDNIIDDNGNGLIDCEEPNCYFSSSSCYCKNIDIIWSTDYSNNLIWFNSQSKEERKVGVSSEFFGDIAWSPNGKLYGYISSRLYEINTNNGFATVIPNRLIQNDRSAGLIIDNNGLFYLDNHTVDNHNQILCYDLASNTTKIIANLPDTTFIYQCTGDLAFKDDNIIMSCNSDTNFFLAKINLLTNQTEFINLSGFSGYPLGLINSADGNIYISGDKNVYSVDINTGISTFIMTSNLIVSRFAGFANTSSSCQKDSCDFSLIINKKDNWCFGDSLLSSVSTLKSSNIIWYLPNGDSIRRNNIKLEMDGLYIVKANILGCNLIKLDTINIHLEKPILFDLGNDTFYCNSFSRVLSTGIQNTLWSTSEVDSSINITKAGTYWATISNRCFEVVDTINIGDGKFNFDLGDKIQLCKNSIEIGIQDLDYKRYLWNTGDTTPFILINNPAVYSLLITNNKNCNYLDSVKVVNDCLNECILPDAFSPNEDDINDFYFPKFDNDEISIVSFNVYNRLGNLVFEGNNNKYKWNGKFKGEKLLSDIYTWYLEYKLENNIIIKKGFVLLLY